MSNISTVHKIKQGTNCRCTY